mgnify:CR=1 FL=1
MLSLSSGCTNVESVGDRCTWMTRPLASSGFGSAPNPGATSQTSASEAIVAATKDAAEIGHFNTGLVAAGRQADFIVLDANPLESISNTRKINKVFLRGQEVPRAEMRAKWQSQFKGAH